MDSDVEEPYEEPYEDLLHYSSDADQLKVLSRALRKRVQTAAHAKPLPPIVEEEARMPEVAPSSRMVIPVPPANPYNAKRREIIGFTGSGMYYTPSIRPNLPFVQSLYWDNQENSLLRTGAQMFVHIHLLGIRGATWLSTAIWDLPENPQPSKDHFVAGSGWPGLSTRPLTDESWEGTRMKFYEVFMQALQAGVYPKKLIIKELTVQAVRAAFDASLSFQIETQMHMRGNAISNGGLLEFAARAAKWLMACGLVTRDEFWKDEDTQAGILYKKRCAFDMLVKLRADGMSSDECVPAINNTTQYIRKTQKWRSATLQTLLNNIHSWFRENQFNNLPYSARNAVSSRPAPVKLRKSWYDDEWLQSLTPTQKKDLQMTGL